MAKDADQKTKKTKPKPKPREKSGPDDPDQLKRFQEAARELGADESQKFFSEVFVKIAKVKKAPKQ